MERRSNITGETNGKADGDPEVGNVASIFGVRDDLTGIIDLECEFHVSRGRYNAATELSLWNSDLRKNLQEATRDKRLNDFLVSLSAGLSMKTWQETCEAYATQLLHESNPTKAVSYLLSIHKIHRAIEIFVEEKMYREAYILARCRVDPEDSILSRILDEWASNASREGNFEEAAQCCIKLGDYARAARLLGRRRDPMILEVATEIGQMTDEPSLSESLAEQAFYESLLASDSITARRFVEKFSQIRHRRAQIEAFEEIKDISGSVIDFSAIFDWLRNGSPGSLLDRLRSRCEIYSEQYDFLSRGESFSTPENEPMLRIATSHDLAMYAIATTTELQMRHLVSAIGAISQYEIVYSKKTSPGRNLLIGLLARLENASPESKDSLFARDDRSACKSLRAFLCLGLLNWLSDTERLVEISEELERLLRLVEILLADALDPRTVRYWATTNEINKLEALLASAIGKFQKAENDEENKEDPTILLERLNNTRNERKRFVDERVCAPSPMLVYGKANHLSSILPEGNLKDNFTKILSDLWLSAIS